MREENKKAKKESLADPWEILHYWCNCFILIGRTHIKGVCFISIELTPSHTAGNKLHENLSLDSTLHTQVFHQTNDCSDQKQLFLHLPHVGTVKNKNELYHLQLI
jgi:hypothetical protein